MQELLKFNQLSPAEKLKQLANFNLDEDTMSDKNAPKISFDQPSYETDPTVEASMQNLGIKDTDQSEIDNNPLFDLNKKIHDPGMDVRSIQASQQLTAEELNAQSVDIGKPYEEDRSKGNDRVDSVHSPHIQDSGVDARTSQQLTSVDTGKPYEEDRSRGSDGVDGIHSPSSDDSSVQLDMSSDSSVSDTDIDSSQNEGQYDQDQSVSDSSDDNNMDIHNEPNTGDVLPGDNDTASVLSDDAHIHQSVVAGDQENQ